MLTTINWRILLVGYFLGFGVFLILDGQALIGVWSIVFGVGGLSVVYLQQPSGVSGLAGWIFFIVWSAVLIWLSVQIIAQ